LAKKKVAKPKRIVTRRQLSRLKKQKRRQRLIRVLGISVILAVIGLVSFGVYYQWYLPEQKPLKETVAEVNDTKFNMQYYIDAINFQLGEYYYYVEYYLDSVLETIEEYELVKQGAEELGFTVSDDEVKETLDSYGYDDNQAARDAIRAQLLVTKLREEYFEMELPTSIEQRYILAMFLESEEQAIDVSAGLEAGEDFGEIAGELSLESTTQENSGDLGWRPKKVLDNLLGTSALDSYVFECQLEVLSQPIYDEDMTKGLGYWLIEVLERKEVEAIEDEVIGSGDGGAGQTYTLTIAPVVSEEIWVNELSALSEDEMKELVDNGEIEVEEIYDEDGNTTEFWIKWQAVDDLSGSSSYDRHYEIDRNTGVINFGDGINGTIPPAGVDNIKADYVAEEANVQAMLLSSEEEAQGVIARLETGEDFGELAEEFSQYGTEGSKADIGWIAEGGMTQAFEDYVFDPETEVNVVSSPIRDATPTTNGGYWLFKVLDEGTREISEEDRDLLVDEAMVDWVASLWDDPENIIVSYLDDDMKNFAINKVLGD
jgi:parvulin-like peptidyl-prolyl isomerase